MDRRRILGCIASAVVLGALGFVVAGCGSSTASPPATTTTSTNSTTTGAGRFNSAAFQKYQSCLKSHGVTLPQFNRPGGSGQTRTFTGPPPGAGTSTTQRRGGGLAGRLANLTPTQRKAAQACQSELPQGSSQFGQGNRTGGGAGGTAFAKYTQCLAKHGVKFGQSGQSSTAFRKAQAACQSLLPAPTTTGATTTTTTS